MTLFKLTEGDSDASLKIPEDGMGFQIARLSRNGTPDSGVVISGLYFAPIDDAPLIRGARMFMPENRDLSQGLYASEPAAEIDLSIPGPYAGRYVVFEAMTRGAKAMAATATVTAPPHTATTQSGDVFYRLSAYRADRRVLPNDSLAPGSYTTTDTDITVVPSGLAAVGRYALPTRISARYLFVIKPTPGTPILYGTVTPNYGLAGGGVEVLFPSGTKPGTVAFSRVIAEK
jgi:hypothetical protein